MIHKDKYAINKRKRKPKIDGITVGSLAEKEFYDRYIVSSGKRYDFQKKFVIQDEYDLGGIRMSAITYKPDFVIYGSDGEIEHVYDVKASITPRFGKRGTEIKPNVHVDSGMLAHILRFQARYRLPVELVANYSGRFRMTVMGAKKAFGVHEFRNIDYDISDYVGM